MDAKCCGSSCIAKGETKLFEEDKEQEVTYLCRFPQKIELMDAQRE
jgi:hypothetical protein